jgi:2-polyprenyl-3-methyl-5-hydroxy-6-metoxy-1,4-benzoquinol methylase
MGLYKMISGQMSCWDMVAHFLDQVWLEYQTNLAGLPESLYRVFRAYYRPMAQAYLNPYQRIGQIAGFQRRVAPVVRYAQKQGAPCTLLDAGCGMGTFSIFFALLGIHATGVDLDRSRVAIAERRLVFYWKEGLSGTVRFELMNLFTFLEEGNLEEVFDVVWVHEAISHITPVTGFLLLTFRVLKPGGIIVISDPNAWNPLTQLTMLRRRGFKRYTQKPDPETGIPVHYAVERIFSAFSLARRLRQAGFTSIETIFHSFVPLTLRGTVLYPRLLIPLEQRAGQLPGIRHLAGSYTIIGHRG